MGGAKKGGGGRLSSHKKKGHPIFYVADFPKKLCPRNRFFFQNNATAPVAAPLRLSSWWFQPISNICASQIGSSPQGIGVKIHKHLWKPPPSCVVFLKRSWLVGVFCLCHPICKKTGSSNTQVLGWKSLRLKIFGNNQHPSPSLVVSFP